LELVWDAAKNELHGSSLLVRDDPYRVDIHVPTGFDFVELVTEPRKSPVTAEVKREGEILVVELLSKENQQVDWLVRFSR
jgi:hypothetical protein